MKTTKLTLSLDAAYGVNLGKDLEWDENGYCKVILSVLDIPNSVGLVYDSKPFIDVIENSEMFLKVLNEGGLYGECGHPKPYGMSRTEFFQRCQEIVETQQMFHIRKVWPQSFTDVKSGQRRLGVFGWIKPSGKFGPDLLAKLQNPHENVAFSLRGYAPVNPRTGKKCLRTLTTWDYVYLPGLNGSNVMNARTVQMDGDVSMESHEISFVLPDDELETAIGSLESEDKREQMKSLVDIFRQEQRVVESTRPSYLF